MPGQPSDITPTASAPPPGPSQVDGVRGFGPFDEDLNARLNEIELLGEEHAARFVVPTHRSPVGPDALYLHMSRNVHQLLLERTRAITIFLAVASLLWTASGLLMRAEPVAGLLVPLQYIKIWCLPITSAVCLILAVLVALWLMRIREGLIYEVAKMNLLVGVPSARVTRAHPFSISSLVQLLISLAGGLSAAVLALHLLYPRLGGAAEGADADSAHRPGPLLWSVLIGVGVAVLLQGMYIIRIYLVMWSFRKDRKLQRSQAGKQG
jgi:hypothetical protein